MTDPNTTYPPSAIGHDWTPGEHDWRHKMKRFSAQPVVAGIMAALAVQIVLGLFGLALGLGSVSATDPGAEPSATTAALGASMWAGASILTSLFYGGFIAARLSKSSCHHEGILHGIVVWASTVVIVTALLASAMGNILGGAAKIASAPIAYAMGNAHHAPQGPDRGMRPHDPDMMKNDTRDLLYGDAPPAGMSADQAQADIGMQLPLLGDKDRADAAHKRIVADLQTQGVTQSDAESRVSAAQGKIEAGKQKAKEAADKAAHAAAKAAVATGILLLLAAFTAALGGSLGALHVKHDRDRHSHEAQAKV